MNDALKVTYEVVGTAYAVSKLLNSLPDTVALDFEAASIFTDLQRKAMEEELEVLDKVLHPKRYRELRSKVASSALTHPKYVQITHLAIGLSETEAAVVVFTSPQIEKIVMKWLTTTTRLQIWHNLSYDGRLIHHRTGLLPINYEDTQILAKTIVNHVEIYKAKTGLKDLAGAKYGDWGISTDNFVMTNLWEEKVLEYAATDGCATFWVYNSVKRHIAEMKEIEDEG